MVPKSQINWQAKLLEVIPLLVGVGMTRKFNLQGWRSLLVYILAANTTRQLIAALEKPTSPYSSEEDGRVKQTNHHHPEVESSGYPQALRTPPAEQWYQVIHATPGRLRVRMPQVEDPQYAQWLQQCFSGNPTIQSYRINPYTTSVTLKYDTDHWTDTEIQEWLGTCKK